MAYAAQSDLLSRITGKELIQLTDDTASGEINQTFVDSDLAEASGIIEGYCRARYAVPLQPSLELMRICRDITVYLLYSRRPQKMKESVRDAYTDALSLLNKVASGSVQLDQPSTAASPQSPVGTAVKPTHQDLRFTERNLEGYI
jgi:phage gp36-like protein